MTVVTPPSAYVRDLAAAVSGSAPINGASIVKVDTLAGSDGGGEGEQGKDSGEDSEDKAHSC
jgi:hypothetical protein